MSSGPDTVTQRSEPPEWAVPYFKGYLEHGTNVANLPYQPYQGSRVAGINPAQAGAYGAVANRAMTGSPEQSAGRGEITKTLTGGYLGRPVAKNPYAGSNPYLQTQIDSAQDDVIRAFNTKVAPAFGTANQRSGSFGNAGLAEAENDARKNLAGELGKISSGMRFGDYTTQQGLAESAINRSQGAYESERGRMMGSLGMVPGFSSMDYTDANALLGVGDALQRHQQASIDDDYSRFTEARDYPLRQLDIIGRMLGGQNYGQSNSSQQPGVNKGAGAIGGGLAGAQLGSMLFPGVGTAAGAGLGALLGLMG